MTTGISSAQVASMLAQFTAQGTWTAPGLFFVQLHTGDPGVAGTTTVASNAVRHTATFSAPTASSGSITNSADITWTSVSATETYSYVSFWNSGTAGAGTFLGSDNLEVARGVTAGDNFTISAANLTISLTPVAA